jgi:ArsR family metal-binding transcriptional regulator
MGGAAIGVGPVVAPEGRVALAVARRMGIRIAQQMREKMQGLMKTMNPFYPPTNYKEIKELPPRMQQRFTRRYDATRAVLTSLVQKAA